jgi:hypothetical protein
MIEALGKFDTSVNGMFVLFFESVGTIRKRIVILVLKVQFYFA